MSRGGFLLILDGKTTSFKLYVVPIAVPHSISQFLNPLADTDSYTQNEVVWVAIPNPEILRDRDIGIGANSHFLRNRLFI